MLVCCMWPGDDVGVLCVISDYVCVLCMVR